MKIILQLLISIIILYGPVTLSGQNEDIGWADKIRYQFSLDGLLQEGAINQGASVKAWYFVKEKIGIGPSLSYRNYASILDETMINTGIEALFLSGKRDQAVRTFGSFQSGLGFAVLNNTGVAYTSVLSSRIFVQPQVGLMINTGRLSDVVISFGYIHQGLDLEFDQAQSDIRLNYNRYIVSLGILF